MPALPRLVRWIVARIAPPDWRESVMGDLAEERARRRAGGRRAGLIWTTAAAASIAYQLRRSQQKGLVAVPQPRARFLETMRFDLRQALRAATRHPSFAIVTVLTLTLGVGANTAVFSLANWLMFRPVPGVSRPDDLVTMRMEMKSAAGGWYYMTVPEMKRVAALPGFASVAAASFTSFHLALDNAPPVRVDGSLATTNYFDVLGQRLPRGRAFTSAEDDPAFASVAVISDHFWKATLNSDPAAIGRRLVLNGAAFEIVGIAEPGFRGPDRSGRTDIWVPVASHRTSMPSYPATLMTSDTPIFSSLVGRPRPGVTLDQIRDHLKGLFAALATEKPKSFKYTRGLFTVWAGPDVPKWQREGLRQMFALLLTVSGLLLLLTCANVATLLFTRAHERYAELATRQALGASRGRIVRQLVTEGLLFAGVGAGLALAGAAAMGQWINGLVIARSLPAMSDVPIDWRVFLFAAGVSVVASVAASILPALVGSRISLTPALAQGARGQSAAGRRVRRVLTALQVGVAVALLSVGLLLVRSMVARYRVPLGYDTRNVLAFSIDASAQGYQEDRVRQLFGDTLDGLRRQPGISQAGYAWDRPFKPVGAGNHYRPADQPDSAPVGVDVSSVSDGFLPALGVRFVDGRDFTAAEARDPAKDGAHVVIVNEALARKLFGTSAVAGRQVLAEFPKGASVTIVGVIEGIRTRQIDYEPVEPTAYQPSVGGGMGWGTIHARLSAPVSVVAPRVREMMRAIDPHLPIYDVELVSESVDRYLAEPRLLARVIAVFALLAVLVAGLGLYGVLARGVEERRKELSIRAALGAGPGALGRLITREALLVTLAGGAVGLGAALWMARLIQSRLFGVTPYDPASMAIAFGIVVAVALASTLAPAKRAVRIDVVRELR
jgi:putative ABC transport system permease protein